MSVQISDNQTKEIVNTTILDQELVNFSAVVFTTSSYDLVISGDYSLDVPMVVTDEPAKRVLSLINAIHQSYPPSPITDVSGIEEIYE